MALSFSILSQPVAVLWTGSYSLKWSHHNSLELGYMGPQHSAASDPQSGADSKTYGENIFEHLN